MTGAEQSPEIAAPATGDAGKGPEDEQREQVLSRLRQRLDEAEALFATGFHAQAVTEFLTARKAAESAGGLERVLAEMNATIAARCHKAYFDALLGKSRDPGRARARDPVGGEPPPLRLPLRLLLDHLPAGGR